MPTSYRYGLGTIPISSPIIYISNTNTNSLVPLTETTESNSLNENLSIFSEECLVDTTVSILKDVTSLFYYFRFKWGS